MNHYTGRIPGAARIALAMRRADFHYELPPELIAQRPAERRSASRMLCLNADGTLSDRHMVEFAQELVPGDLLVFNNARVIPARLHGVKDTGGQVEVLIERVLDASQALAQVRASKPPRPGARLHLARGALQAEVQGREGEFYRLRFDTDDLQAALEQHGDLPLPPYIERPAGADDRERYQTVFASVPGAVAAPTAGLHFDRNLLDAIAARGVETGFVTLHVGAGTFQPVRVEELEQHRMHAERLSVGGELAARINATRARGGRVVAVGTTVVRALESAVGEDGLVRAFDGETRLFITPGCRFRAVDALLTNFHLPESTLLMLVCAFGGYARVMAAYRHAVAAQYRFFSYGDAMWLPVRAAPAAAGEAARPR
ncbi:MAG: tRNA preQ1(34) S-adenosylmethionine ribosyltransferase-isomerase QueA [Nevskia sp.]|nr:tRNA preQ1(34) S-adenosylmethionine ribosyltransferase-isomerase QueA [Nevskia sp.]